MAKQPHKQAASKEREFDTKIKQQFDRYQAKVSSELWDRITSELDQGASPIAQPTVSRTRRIPFWSIAAAIIVVLGGAWWFGQINQTTKYLRTPSKETLINAQTVRETPPTDAENKTPETTPTQVARLHDDSLQENETLTTLQKAPEADLEITKLPQEAVSPKNTISEEYAAQSAEREDVVLYLKELPMTMLLKESDIEPSQRLVEDNRPVSGVSRLLNAMVSRLDKRPEKFVSFSSSEEGSLKVSLNY